MGDFSPPPSGPTAAAKSKCGLLTCHRLQPAGMTDAVGKKDNSPGIYPWERYTIGMLSPGRDGRNGIRTVGQGSAAPTGADRDGRRLPSDKSLGYYRSSLPGLREVPSAGRP